MRRHVLAFAIVLSPASAGAEAERLPAFALAGPYGSPFTLAARPPVALPIDPTGASAGRPVSERGLGPLSSTRIAAPAGTTGASGRKNDDDDDDDDEDPVPAKPGSLPTTFMKVPDPVPNQKKRTMGPHLKPDAAFDLDDRTTVGIISQLDRLHTTASQTILGKSMPSTTTTRSVTGTTGHGRDLGFGASLEFKLGQ